MESPWLMLLMMMVMASQSSAVTPVAKATTEVARILTEDYDKKIRPPGHGGTQVKLQVYFRNIDIDDVTMEANFDITFRMLWNDSRLSYLSMPGAENVDYVSLLDPSPLWLPDPFFKNAEITQYKSIHPELYLRIFPDGNIIYSTRISLRQSCPMDLKRFPHDTQTCMIKVASYGYTTKDVDLKFGSLSSVEFGSGIHADRFRFEEYNTEICNSITSTGEYSCAQVNMKIRREFGTYLIECYIPCMFLVVVAWFSFLVPEGQFVGRVLLTLVPLIALTSFSNAYKGSLASVPYATAMDTFIGVSLCILFLTLVYVILCNARTAKKGEEKASVSSEEDGEVKAASREVEGGWMRRLAHQMKERAEYISRVTLMSVYFFFLFVYFVAFCGTG
ncbi:glutamate-gated chloride channel-like isoform X2 [Portunus trituberculatus]|uniref:glutamate-gated chloride channel-like isoform X2 n=1 Tax=Portunus trituberculatus TaxID=210409 RepID=UPI001E1CE3D2|nr:glutamate-gated chloride channel-like isoform X2 [Portunus trituberculatus]